MPLSRWLTSAVTALSLLATGPALALDSIKMLVPANPGGGCNQTGRSLQQALQTNNIVKKIRVDNKGGTGGTIGLAQFINSSKGGSQRGNDRRQRDGRRDFAE